MKIKYIYMLFIALSAIAINTKAQEIKNQYVKWNNVPNPSVDQAVAWLKKAMTGENIPGASVRSDAKDYSQVWGGDIYKEVLDGKGEQFWLGPTPGGEQNYALNSVGNAVPSDFLKSGVDIIAFKRQNGEVVSIAKWGTNGCLNALNPMLLGTSKVDDGPDLDVVQQKKEEFSLLKTPEGNVNVYITNTNTSSSTSTSKSENSAPWFSSGEPVLPTGTTGGNFQSYYQQEDPRMQIMQPGQLLGDGMYGYGGGMGQQVFYRPRASFWDIANTAINAGSVVGQFINANKIANAIRSQQPSQQLITNNYNSYPRQPQYPQYPQPPRGPGFSWPNNQQQPYNPGFIPISPSTGGIYNNTGYGFNSGAILQPGDLLSGGITSGRGNGFGW